MNIQKLIFEMLFFFYFRFQHTSPNVQHKCINVSTCFVCCGMLEDDFIKPNTALSYKLVNINIFCCGAPDPATLFWYVF